MKKNLSTVIVFLLLPSFSQAEEHVWDVTDNPHVCLKPSNAVAGIRPLIEAAMERLNQHWPDADVLVLKFPAEKGPYVSRHGVGFPRIAAVGKRRLVFRGDHDESGPLTTLEFPFPWDLYTPEGRPPPAVVAENPWCAGTRCFSFNEPRNVTVEHLHFTRPRRYAYQGQVLQVDGRKVHFRVFGGFMTPTEYLAFKQPHRQLTIHRFLGDPLDPWFDPTQDKHVHLGIQPVSEPDRHYVCTLRDDRAPIYHRGDWVGFKSKVGGDTVRVQNSSGFTLHACWFTNTTGRAFKARGPNDRLVVTGNRIDRGKPVDTDGDGRLDMAAFYAANGGGMMITFGGQVAPIITGNTIIGTADDGFGLNDDNTEHPGRAPCRGLYVAHNTIRDIHGRGIILRPAVDATIKHNTIMRTRGSAVFINGEKHPSMRVRVHDNVVVSPNSAAFTVGPLKCPNPHKDIVIENNTVRDLVNGLLLLSCADGLQFRRNTLESFHLQASRVALVSVQGNASAAGGDNRIVPHLGRRPVSEPVTLPAGVDIHFTRRQ